MISDAVGKLAAKGAAFLAALTFFKKILGIIRNVILARLLAPEDFGLLALALVLIQGMESLTFVGVDNYLIQKKKISNTLVRNAWFLNIIRGMVLTLLSLAVCPFYSKLVNEPAILQILWIVAFNPFLEGLKNPGSILAEREIRFGRISLYETLCAFLEVAVVVIMAWFIRDAEALAWGVLLGTLVKSLLSFFFFPIPGRPGFDLTHQIKLLSVVKHFIIIAVGTLVMVQGDNLIIGAVEGSKALGIYVIAYQLAVFPVLFLQEIANRVALPVFSSLQYEKERLHFVLNSVVQLQLAVIIPFVIVLAVFAHELIIILYGDKWAQAGIVLNALVFVTLGKGLTHVCVPYILGTGAFSFASRMKIAETSVFLVSVYCGVRFYGLTGAALGAGVGYMTAGVGRIIYLCLDAGLSFFRISTYIILPIGAILPGVLIATYLSGQVTWHHSVETIIALLIVCLGYIAGSFLVQKKMVVMFFKKIMVK
ncbi:MAG: oligosaccharide flippase family protein [Candidatus Electrothrix sp. Rat3]|nr:oligosaccharide flippase family protein [Candidatus Electrothrix rattekaaiensis]